jgi:hypothetical protein
MKSKLLLLLCLTVSSCTNNTGIKNSTGDIHRLLDKWHAAAGRADYDSYFDMLSADAIFMGTDATEHWNKKQFQEFSKPFFDRGKAWNFTSLQRHVYFDKSGNMAWFDELLNTQMKICRGSGVVANENGNWKIKQYVLSVTVPNDSIDEVIKIKTPIEDILIDSLESNKNLR